MEINRLYLIPMVLIWVIFNANAQDASGVEKESYFGEGTINASATITPGILKNYSYTSIYINGFLEYFLDNKVSIKGEGYLYLGQQQKPSLLKNNHYLFFGPSYHFGKNNLDLYASFQPGINFSQPNIFNQQLKAYDLKVLPAASISIGSTYYFWKYFNFFGNIKYLIANYRGEKTLKLNEIAISLGLGFHISTKQ